MTKEKALERLKKHNTNIILIGEYVSLKNKTEFKCKSCDSVRITSFYNLLNSTRRHGCIYCEKRKKNRRERSRTKPHEQYIKEVYDVWGDLVEIIGQYDGANNKIKTKCNICELIWNPEAKALLKKHGCPKCGHKKNRSATVKKQEDYVAEVNEKHNKRLLVIGTYTAGKNRIEIKCNMCQHEWMPVARNILKGRGCPKCNLNKGETLINNILIDLGLNFKQQFTIENLKTPNNGVPIFDFAIFDENNDLKLIIEYDGLQHFKPVKAWGGEKRFIEQQKIDNFKNEYCMKNNIRLLRIKYDELDKINHNYIKEKIYER